MIVHSRIAKLYRHLHDPGFSRVMAEIGSALEEGLESFDVEMQRVDDNIRFEIIEALEAMAYDVTYSPDDALLHVEID